MKKLLFLSLLLAISLLGACNSTTMTPEEIENPKIEQYNWSLLEKHPQGVNNGTVSLDVFTALMYVNIQHNLYLEELSKFDLNSDTIGKVKSEQIYEITEEFRSNILSVSTVEVTPADEEIAEVLYRYMVNLAKEADNTGRYIMHRDKINLKQAIEYRIASKESADELDELVSKYQLY